MAGITIRTTGVSELRRDLRAVDKSFGPELGKANQQAALVVVPEARRRALALRGPHQGGGKVAPISSTITALRRQQAASVAIGGARSPHAAPTEFGGTLARHHSSSRTRVAKRAYLFPAIEAKAGEIVQVYSFLLDRLMARAFNR